MTVSDGSKSRGNDIGSKKRASTTTEYLKNLDRKPFKP